MSSYDHTARRIVRGADAACDNLRREVRELREKMRAGETRVARGASEECDRLRREVRELREKLRSLETRSEKAPGEDSRTISRTS